MTKRRRSGDTREDREIQDQGDVRTREQMVEHGACSAALNAALGEAKVSIGHDVSLETLWYLEQPNNDRRHGSTSSISQARFTRLLIACRATTR